jgi:hypothetical protein
MAASRPNPGRGEMAALLRFALGASAAGWFGLGVHEWLRSRPRTTAATDGPAMRVSSTDTEAARPAA